MILDSNTTIKYFKEIAKIPRESGHEEKIAKYLCEFAELRNLEYEKDEYNNVLIKKNNCNKTPLILQVHTDMVCEKEQNKCFDFEEDSIEVMEKNGYLHANGTTLGADNGIGIAQILTILDSNIETNIEAIFTVSEETSMLGSINFDTSKLNGKMLLNLDGFEENTILIESAGFYDIILKMHNKFKNIQDNNFNVYEINLTRIKRWSFWF
ncbi:MAG: M20/M25/M40 family metallo-hydrolase [Clostridia bacterium]|jgi:dipeptidase D